jgi:ATP-dependent helicase HrpB
MSALLGEGVGGRVGYRVRRESRVSAATRIEVVTEGILTRVINADPTLEGVGLVVFDEFHERSMQGDLGLALALHSQRLVRDDLRLLVMSATLDPAPVAGMLHNAPVVSSTGRSFPVEILYLPHRHGRHVDRAVPAAVEYALHTTTGDILVFLPGQAEIRRAASLIDPPSSVDLYPLYGNLSFAEQDRAIAPSAPGRRKIVLATSIAESSLTIEGVRCVIDGGLARVPRFSPRTGMTALQTVRVSRASADQRAGRAGRVAPGRCIRLWPAEAQAHLVPFAQPEILEADLTPLALDLALAGIHDANQLAWIDRPPSARLTQARELLRLLGALDSAGAATPHGHRMAEFGTHPRLAHLLTRAPDLPLGAEIADLVALLEARDVLHGDEAHHDADLRTRIEVLNVVRLGRPLPDRVEAGMTVSRDAVLRVRDESNAWRRVLHVPPQTPSDPEAIGALVALAFPDRVAQARKGMARRFLLRGGSGATLHDSPALHSCDYLAVAETDGKSPDSKIHLCAPLAEADVRTMFAGQIEIVEHIEWNDRTQSVQATSQERLGALVLKESRTPCADASAVAAVVAAAVRQSGLRLLNWTQPARQLQARFSFLHAFDATWPDASDGALAESLDRWLGSRLYGVHSGTELRAINVTDALLDLLDWNQRRELDALAPTHFVAPTASRLPIDYSDPRAPVIRVRLQEMFGCLETPRLLGGRVPLTLHLLSPAHRPVQVTQNLATFWASSYGDVRRELRGRYPRHAWPEDPLSAQPTRRAKPRGT